MKTYNPENSRQIWIESDIGQQWVNFETSKPMIAGNGRNWFRGECDYHCLILDARDQSQALTRSWDAEEKSVVFTWDANGSQYQRFNYLQVF